MTSLTLEIFERFREKVLEKLRTDKISKELRAHDLAEKSGLAVQTIYSLAGGHRGKAPEFTTIFKLAQAMGWTMEDIATELFPDRAGLVYRLIREYPRIFDHILTILDSGSESDMKKIESDLEYMAKKISS